MAHKLSLQESLLHYTECISVHYTFPFPLVDSMQEGNASITGVYLNQMSKTEPPQLATTSNDGHQSESCDVSTCAYVRDFQ